MNLSYSPVKSTCACCSFFTIQPTLLSEEPLRIAALGFTRDRRYLLTGKSLSGISFYRLRDGQPAYQLPAPRTKYLDFSEDDRLLLTAHEDRGLLSLYLLLSNLRQQGNYQQVADLQPNNRNLKNQQKLL